GPAAAPYPPRHAVHQHVGAGREREPATRSLHGHRPVQAVRPACGADADALRALSRHSWSSSSVPRSFVRTPLARTTVRSARTIRPCRPITLPRSASATVTRSTRSPFATSSVTTTASGSSTSRRTRNSANDRESYGWASLASVDGCAALMSGLDYALLLRQGLARARRLRATAQPGLGRTGA